MTREEELARLVGQQLALDRPVGKILVTFNVHCAANAALVLSRTKEVLRTVLEVDPSDWPSIDEWRCRLPGWFLERSADDSSTPDAGRKWHLPFLKRSQTKRRWPLEAFLFWFTPTERAWFWWNASIENSNLFQIEVIATDLPFPWDALEWLLRASGALRVEEL